MDIAWLRDLVIIILGILSILLFIPLVILIIYLYKKTNELINSIKATTDDARQIVESIKEEFVNPLSKIVVIFQTIKQVSSLVSDFMKKQSQPPSGGHTGE